MGQNLAAGLPSSYWKIDQTGIVKLLRIEQVAAVEDGLFRECLGYCFKIRGTEDLPLGYDGERIGARKCCHMIGSETNPIHAPWDMSEV